MKFNVKYDIIWYHDWKKSGDLSRIQTKILSELSIIILFLKEESLASYDKPINNIVNIDYSNLDKDVFDNLSDEEINDLFADIANEAFEDEDYESNLDSIIENVFGKYGIDISSNLDAVKSKLKKSKPIIVNKH